MPPTLQAAYDRCSGIAKAHYENFPVGGILIPQKRRKHFHALYAFMRTADDFADLPHRSKKERLSLLSELRSKLHFIFNGGQSSDHIFIALQDTVTKFELSIEPFDLLLDAFEFDARGDVRFNTYDDLHWYTRRSAEPVGQLVLALFGYRDRERLEWSNYICTALQLINFLQDSGDDLGNGRCYFPQEDYVKFGIQSPVEIASSPKAGELIKFECDRIERLLRSGSELPDRIGGRLKLELRAVMTGAVIMVKKIRRLKGRVITVRPILSTVDKLSILLQALLHGV